MDKRTLYPIVAFGAAAWLGRFLVYVVAPGPKFAQQAFANSGVQLTSMLVIAVIAGLLASTQLGKYAYSIPLLAPLLGCALFAIERRMESGEFPTSFTLALTAVHWMGAGVIGTLAYGVSKFATQASKFSSK